MRQTTVFGWMRSCSTLILIGIVFNSLIILGILKQKNNRYSTYFPRKSAYGQMTLKLSIVIIAICAPIVAISSFYYIFTPLSLLKLANKTFPKKCTEKISLLFLFPCKLPNSWNKINVLLMEILWKKDFNIQSIFVVKLMLKGFLFLLSFSLLLFLGIIKTFLLRIFFLQTQSMFSTWCT